LRNVAGKAVLRHYGHECLVKPQLSVLLGVDTRMQPLEVMAARAADIDLSMCKMLVRWTGKKQCVDFLFFCLTP
jgi:hypothetical protein